MEGIVKKQQQKFKKVREELDRWDELQRLLLSQFTNVSSILERLHVIGENKYYGSLRGIHGIQDDILSKQMESFDTILLSINNTLEKFHGIVLFLEKMVRDSKQQMTGGSHRLSTKQMQQRIGVKPSVSDCLDGLATLQEMHSSEFRLKKSVISSLVKLFSKPSTTDLGALRQLLFDQPNIPKDEVQHVFDIIFAEDMS